MNRNPDRAFTGLLTLSALFISALVTCNLIAKKLTTVDLGFIGFQEPLTISVGTLPYPLTFLVTDILSEVYGKRRASQVVLTGFAASILVMGILWLALWFPAKAEGVSGEAFSEVFGSSWRVILASMIAYLAAQLVDVQLFHFWKRLTRGRHLWLRNNASTICSQLLDTVLVVTVLFYGEWPTGQIYSVILDMWIFKMLCALADTPLAYLAVGLFRRYVVPVTASSDEELVSG